MEPSRKLYDSAKHGRWDEFLVILSNPHIDINFTSSSSGYTALHQVAWWGNVDIMGQLLAKRPNVNIQNNDRRTPLDLALEKGHQEAVRVLLGVGGEKGNGLGGQGNGVVYQRKIEPADTDLHTFTVLQFNVLADYYVHSEAHPNLAPHHANWEYRKKLIVAEIFAHAPDFVCLQEIDEKFVQNFYKMEFSARGYDMMYQRKPFSEDGCLLAYKIGRFTMTKNVNIEFRNSQLVDIATSNQVAIIAEFFPHDFPKKKIVVGVTHLKSGSEPIIRTLQSYVLAEEINKFCTLGGRASTGECPLVVCGDYNGSPEEPFYELLTCGELSATTAAAWQIPDTVSARRTHVILKSAYNVNLIPYTQYAHWGPSILDYIFFRGGIEVTGLLEILPGKNIVLVPNQNYPSDHFALLARFKFSEDK